MKWIEPAHALASFFDRLLLLAEELNPALLHLPALLGPDASLLGLYAGRLLLQAARLGRHANGPGRGGLGHGRGAGRRGGRGGMGGGPAAGQLLLFQKGQLATIEPGVTSQTGS